MSGPITPGDIAALPMTLAACTPMERLTNMEVRAVLELLKQRGYLVKPIEEQMIGLPEAARRSGGAK